MPQHCLVLTLTDNDNVITVPQKNLSILFDTKQEGRAVTGNHRTMQGTCMKSLHLILEQHSDLEKTLKLSANIGKLSKTTLEVYQ